MLANHQERKRDESYNPFHPKRTTTREAIPTLAGVGPRSPRELPTRSSPAASGQRSDFARDSSRDNSRSYLRNDISYEISATISADISMRELSWELHAGPYSCPYFCSVTCPDPPADPPALSPAQARHVPGVRRQSGTGVEPDLSSNPWELRGWKKARKECWDPLGRREELLEGLEAGLEENRPASCPVSCPASSSTIRHHGLVVASVRRRR